MKMARGYSLISLTGFLLAGLFACVGAAPANAVLQAPVGYLQGHLTIRVSEHATDCPPLNIYQGGLEIPSKYVQSEKSKDVIDDDNEARYAALSAPMSDLQQLSAALTDKLFKGNGTEQDLQCLRQHWLAWAKAGALLQPTKSAVGKAIRKWTLGAIAANYLKIKLNLPEDDPTFPKVERQTLERWLGLVAGEVVKDYSHRKPEQINNHDYWAAWGVMTTAVVLNRADLFNWSGEIYLNAMAQVNADGELPNELKRRSRALSYHNFALQPLVLLAAFGEANGQPWLSADNAALQRLAALVIHNLDDSSVLAQAAEAKQVKESLREHGRLAWLAPYIAISGNREWLPLLKSLSTLKMTRLGGDLSYLYLRNEPGFTQ
ncbi:MAG: polysaccharide lyase [Tolumonas sp.]|nr:polysaccharide lyase [Tolumonas sp.]